MLLKKYRVIIDIHSQTFCYQITHALVKNLVFEQKNDIAFVVNHRDIEETINNLLESISQYLPKKKWNQFFFEVNISPADVQHKRLSLPAVSLFASEIFILVEASIDKLFSLSAGYVVFDYVSPINDKRQLHVAICERHYITEWVSLFSKRNLSLQFIGLSTDNKAQFNFLPWRLSLQRKRKIRLTIMLITYMSVMLLTLGYLWRQSNNDSYQYQQLIAKNQIFEKTLLNKIAETAIHYPKSQQQLYQFLLMLSEKTPSSISLYSMDYSPSKMHLVGDALSYLDISQFSDLLNQEKKVKKSKIESAQLKQNNLIFEMDIDLYE